MSRWMSALPLLFASAVLCGAPAQAWGPDGHSIVAAIAEARLDPEVLQKVQQLLAGEAKPTDHLDQISSWADDFRISHGETGPWHFVDIPLNAQSYDANRDCANDNCIVAQIVHFSGVLGDQSALPRDRLQALKFLVHFVGDIHQPLHCETDLSRFPPPEGDRGGNKVTFTFLKKHTNLHSVWDGQVIDDELGIIREPHDFTAHLDETRPEAATLNSEITDQQAATWAPNGLSTNLLDAVTKWANDSHALAKTAYRELPKAPRPHGWDETYETEFWPVMQDQFKRAGVRLAEILNETLH